MKKKDIEAILDHITFIVDTREQDTHIHDWLSKKGKNVIRKKLSYGDYSFCLLKNEELGICEDIYFSDIIVVERKNSFEEIIGNFTADNGVRLEKELKNCPAKMTLIIEDMFDKACLGTYGSQFNRKSLLGKLATIPHRYDIPVVYLTKLSTPVWIYTHFRYYLREMLLTEKINIGVDK